MVSFESANPRFNTQLLNLALYFTQSAETNSSIITGYVQSTLAVSGNKQEMLLSS